MSSPILSAFNNQFKEFMNDILCIFPNDKDLMTTKNMMTTLQKGNPRLLIQIWKNFIADPYANEIEAGNISFFIDKDYNSDVSELGDSEKIVKAIDRLREPIKNMDDENQQACMKYIQNLSKLSGMYMTK
uniref:Uncharacterized protein n=1 Tax=viral metagenome TaxID=1070528 RepID=A0A6C0EGG3_9ZZZZ